MLQLHDIFIISVSLVLFPFTAEQTSYEQLEHLINRYAYAMDPEEPGDKSLITDLPNLYSDALETYAAKESGAMNGKIACLLLIGIFKNSANIIKDKLATSEFPYISPKLCRINCKLVHMASGNYPGERLGHIHYQEEGM